MSKQQTQPTNTELKTKLDVLKVLYPKKAPRTKLLQLLTAAQQEAASREAANQVASNGKPQRNAANSARSNVQQRPLAIPALSQRCPAL